MTDTTILERPSQVAIVRECTGFVVSLQAGGQHQYEHYEDLDQAIAAYDEPPAGWQAIGISAAHNGVPYCRLEASVVMAVRGERKA